MVRDHPRVALAGALAGLALLALTAGPLFAQEAPTPGPTGPVTHEQMEQMMDAMHGAGTSQRMHEAMGPQAEQMMDQCVAMMNMMMGSPGMMGAPAGQPGVQMPDMTAP